MNKPGICSFWTALTRFWPYPAWTLWPWTSRTMWLWPWPVLFLNFCSSSLMRISPCSSLLRRSVLHFSIHFNLWLAFRIYIFNWTISLSLVSISIQFFSTYLRFSGFFDVIRSRSSLLSRWRSFTSISKHLISCSRSRSFNLDLSYSTCFSYFFIISLCMVESRVWSERGRSAFNSSFEMLANGIFVIDAFSTLYALIPEGHPTTHFSKSFSP